MKLIVLVFILLLRSLTAGAKEPGPSQKVCVPKVDLNYLEFQFQIRKALPPCLPNEKELEVRRGENDALLLVPPEPEDASSPSKGPY